MDLVTETIFRYGVQGQPPRSHNFTVRGKHYTSVAIISTNGFEDVYITELSVDGELLLFFIHWCILPLLYISFNSKLPLLLWIMLPYIMWIQ